MCPARSSCLANRYLAGTCAGRTDYTCPVCPSHSHSECGGVGIGACECDAGYFNDQLDDGSVRCVPLPPRFHFDVRSKCDMKDMHFGTEMQVGPRATIKAATLGQMINYLDASTVLLKQADFDSFCQATFVNLERREPICGIAFPLFDKLSAAHEAKFLG